MSSIQLDTTIVMVCMGLALGAGLLVALVPALAALRLPPMEVIRQGGGAPTLGAGPGRIKVRSVLVAGQVALAVLLLVASALTIQSLRTLLAAQTGYDASNVLTARVGLASRAQAGGPDVAERWEAVLSRLAALPGVRSVAVGSCSPVGERCEGTSITPAGHTASGHVGYHVVSPGYFGTLGIPVRRGRNFLASDREGPTVAVINEAAARTIWGTDDPLLVPIGTGDDRIHVIGVVGDVRFEDIDAEPQPAIFMLMGQATRSQAIVVLRTDGPPASLTPMLRREVQAVDRGHTVSSVRTLREALDDVTVRDRFTTNLLSVFAGVSLALAALGIYGLLALSVAQRTREIGIRSALGARSHRTVRMIVGQAVVLAGAGALIGAVAALVATRAMQGVLYEVSATDPRAYSMSIAILLIVAVGAALVPAIRATRVSPMEALRSE